MPVLDPVLVKAGKVAPQPGDLVNGYAYVGGDPTSNDSYQPATGNDFLNSIPPARANIARAVLQGKAPYPSLSRNNKLGAQIVQDVLAAEPGFDATAYKRRVDMIKDFTTGKTATLIQALNQAPLHALSLSDAYDHLNNSSILPQVGNDVLTNVEASFGNTKQQAARGAFNEAQPAVADELATLYKGSSGTIPGIAAQEHAFPSGAAPAESNGALRTASELMKDRQDTIMERWKNGMGSQADMFPVVSPKSRAALETLYNRYHPEEATPAAPASFGMGKPAAAVTTPQKRKFIIETLGQ